MKEKNIYKIIYTRTHAADGRNENGTRQRRGCSMRLLRRLRGGRRVYTLYICGYILHSGRPARSRRAFRMDMHVVDPMPIGHWAKVLFSFSFSFVRSFIPFFFFLVLYTDIYSYSFQQLFGGKKKTLGFSGFFLKDPHFPSSFGRRIAKVGTRWNFINKNLHVISWFIYSVMTSVMDFVKIK